jgi:hypothetical protein
MENREDAYPLGDITPVTPDLIHTLVTLDVTHAPVTPDLIRGPCVGFCAGRKAKRGWIPGQARDDSWLGKPGMTFGGSSGDGSRVKPGMTIA